MATYYPRYYYKDSVGLAESKVKPVYQQRYIDFAVRNVATSDVVNMIAVPDNTLVTHVNYQTLATVTDATSSWAVASVTATITYVTAAVSVAAGLFGVPAAISASTAQKWYAAKDDIAINSVTVANMTAGVVKVFAIMLMPQPYLYINAAGTTKTYSQTDIDKNNWTTTAPVIPNIN